MKKALRHLALFLLAPLCLSATAQTDYSYTLPTIQGSQLSSWVNFSFPATPPTNGEATLQFQWLACWQAAFGGSSKIWIELKTGPTTYTQVYYETGNTSECTALARTATVPAAVFAAALNVGNGALAGRVKIQDACYPGVGCSFSNDPQVLGLNLAYAVHPANFTAANASICPGGTIQFTDASLNTPSSYQWLFPGGEPASSTGQNPTVQYAASGTYDVTLIVETADGMDTLVRPTFVTVHAAPPANAGVDEDLCAGESAQLEASGGITYQWFPATGLDDPNSATPIADPAISTSYVVLVTDANGCTANDDMVLTVHPRPIVMASAGGNAICMGDTAHVVATGAQLYQWTPNLFISSTSGASVNVWPNGTFTWTLTGTDAFGCVDDSSYTLTVHPLPAAPLISNAGSELSASAAEGYQWYLDGTPIGGANAQSWEPLTNGNYTVQITDANGCTAMALPFYFGNVGLADAGTTGLRTYPQPVRDVLVLEGLLQKTGARISNVQGALVWQGVVQAGTSRVDL
ncbi:MAG: PKD domain-containing protein, partial [Flavobacteriales bacterium]